MTDSAAPQFRDFLTASSLSPATAVEFGENVRAFEGLDPKPEPFAQAGPETKLPKVRDKLQKLFRSRQSDRDFGSEALTKKELGLIFAAMAERKGRRTYASAGGLYPVHTFALVVNAEGEWANAAVRYEPDGHALGVTNPKLPASADVFTACSLDEGITPQAIIVFVIYPDELERKYGERAGRFALIEVGHAAQNLALRLAKSKLKGYELGGVQDTEVKTLLGLDGTGALIAHGYAVGK